MGKVVDFRITLPLSEWAGQGPGSETSYLRNYGRVYSGERGELRSGEAMVQALVDAGVDLAVLQAEWSFGDCRAMNEAVARLVRQYPDRLVGFAGPPVGAAVMDLHPTAIAADLAFVLQVIDAVVV